jgi:exodeoxyribonuclease-3
VPPRQLPLSPPSGPGHQPAAGTIRLLIFNTQHASPARARRQAAWIAGQDTADLLILTEVGPGPGGYALIDALTGHGYLSTLAPEPFSPDYRTVLAARGADLAAVPSGSGATKTSAHSSRPSAKPCPASWHKLLAP